MTDIFGIQFWNTESLRNSSYMFNNCVLLNNIDISFWNVHNVISMKNIFLKADNAISNSVLDNIFIKWGTLYSLNYAVTIHFGEKVTYTNNSIINFHKKILVNSKVFFHFQQRSKRLGSVTYFNE